MAASHFDFFSKWPGGIFVYTTRVCKTYTTPRPITSRKNKREWGGRTMVVLLIRFLTITPRGYKYSYNKYSISIVSCTLLPVEVYLFANTSLVKVYFFASQTVPIIIFIKKGTVYFWVFMGKVI